MTISRYLARLRSKVGTPGLELVAGLGGRNFRHTYPNGDLMEFSIFVYAGTVSGTEVFGPRDSADASWPRLGSSGGEA